MNVMTSSAFYECNPIDSIWFMKNCIIYEKSKIRTLFDVGFG